MFSVLINNLFLKFSKNLGIRNLHDELIRWGPKTKPALGGISFYIIFLLSLTAYVLFPLGENQGLNKQLIGLVLAVTLGFLIGLTDDAYNTNPFLKFLGQFTCANILVSTGTNINITHDFTLNYVFTVFWVIGMMNSINMLDNMDGIAGLVSTSIIISALSLIILQNDLLNPYIIVLLGTLGAIIGFLVFNWYPSKMYMGDMGSQFLGIFLAAIGIEFFWGFRNGNGYFIQLKQFMIPLMVFIVPVIDTLTVFIRRTARGQSPFIGGKDHTTHQLANLGLRDDKVVLILGCISYLSVFIVIVIYKTLEKWNPWYSLFIISYFALVFFSIQFFYKKGKMKFDRLPLFGVKPKEAENSETIRKLPNQYGTGNQ